MLICVCGAPSAFVDAVKKCADRRKALTEVPAPQPDVATRELHLLNTHAQPLVRHKGKVSAAAVVRLSAIVECAQELAALEVRCVGVSATGPPPGGLAPYLLAAQKLPHARPTSPT
jgi:hypothetical protein